MAKIKVRHLTYRSDSFPFWFFESMFSFRNPTTKAGRRQIGFPGLRGFLSVGECSEPNSEEIPKFQLRDIVADVLIMHEVSIRVLGFVVADAFFDVRLYMISHRLGLTID